MNLVIFSNLKLSHYTTTLPRYIYRHSLYLIARLPQASGSFEHDTLNWKGPAHPQRCFQWVWITRPPVRLRLGGAMLGVTSCHRALWTNKDRWQEREGAVKQVCKVTGRIRHHRWKHGGALRWPRPVEAPCSQNPDFEGAQYRFVCYSAVFFFFRFSLFCPFI